MLIFTLVLAACTDPEEELEENKIVETTELDEIFIGESPLGPTPDRSSDNGGNLREVMKSQRVPT